jgi:O-succinylbenzoate synthase
MSASWPELGDPTLEDCLVDLADGQESALVRRTLDCLRVDGRAREENRSLFEGLHVPSSHATLPLLNELVLSEAVREALLM